MLTKGQVTGLVNWEGIPGNPRYSSDHEEMMRSIFGDSAQVVAIHTDGTQYGGTAIAYEFRDGTVVVLTDYFGSCGDCDWWDGASDDEVRASIQSLVNSARVLADREAARQYCASVKKCAGEYPMWVACYLAPLL